MTIARHRFLFCTWISPGALRAVVISSLLTALSAWADSSPVAVASLATTAAASPSSDVADFMVNIARYTSWPKAATPKSLILCYAHGGALQTVATSAVAADHVSNVNGIPVVWQVVNTPRQTAGCNMVWLNADVRPAPREWLHTANDRPILTLSNYADFTADGGIIGAYRVGSDWRFEINLEALHRSRINIAAVALRLSQKQRVIADSGLGR